jgi:hypothetical protein
MLFIQVVTWIRFGHFLPGHVNLDKRWTRSKWRPESCSGTTSLQNGQPSERSPDFCRQMDNDNSSMS